MNRKLILIGAVAVVVLLLAGGAYKTLQLLAESVEPAPIRGGGQTIELVQVGNDGPQLEVLPTRNTRLYQDDTDVTGQMPAESGEVQIVQQVRPAADSGAIAEDMVVQVWGERRGERIVADVLVFGPLAGGALE